VLEGLDATSEQVEDAIALQPTAPQRQQLTQWWIELSQHTGIETAVAAVLTGAPVQKSELEQLIEALPFAESVEDFASIVEDSPREAVEEAIALQPDQARRQQLTKWWESLTPPQTAPQPTESDDQPWVISFLRKIAESDRFEELKKFVSERRFSVETLRKLSPKIQEVGGSFQPYKKLNLMLDALEGLTSIWITNPYLELVE
jgi:hypothetical protein